MQTIDKAALLREAQTLYREFNSEQKQIVQNKQIASIYTANRWLYLLDLLGKHDHYVDQYLAKTPNLKGYFIGFTIFYYFLMIFGSGILAGDFGWGFLPILILWLLPVIPWVWYSTHSSTRLRRMDLANYFRDYAYPVLVHLREESKPDQSVDLKVFMKNVSQSKYRTGIPHLKAQEKTIRSGVEQKFYECDLMALKTQLADGSLIDYQLSLLIRERMRYKRKGNKYKLQVRAVHQLVVAMPKKQYQVANSTSTRNRHLAVQFLEKEKRHIFKIKNVAQIYVTKTAYKGNYYEEYKKLDALLGKDRVFAVDTFVNMLGEAYRRAKPQAT
ncbi:MAG: hypothetical protein HC880_15730 [Bacteroidia bacterium]|nr:hypothetical protein [Bacteroidia bacterium]